MEKVVTLSEIASQITPPEGVELVNIEGEFPIHNAFHTVVREDLCSGCRICEGTCTSLSFDEERKVMRVNETSCKGCGTCVAQCPAGALQHVYSGGPFSNLLARAMGAETRMKSPPFRCEACPLLVASMPKIEYSPETKVLRLICSGRLNASLVLEGFERGADGVLVIGCFFGDSGSGKKEVIGRAKTELEKIESILHLLGLDGRLCYEEISPFDENFRRVVDKFAARLQTMGSMREGETIGNEKVGKEIGETIRETKAFYCLECGKCTSICPVSKVNQGYSPRLNVERASFGYVAENFIDKNIWSCLTCNTCQERCPSGVRYLDFIKSMRAYAFKLGETGIRTHAGMLFSLMRLMSRDWVRQNRLDGMSGLKLSKRGKILYFVGCAPYFDQVFDAIGVDFSGVTKAVVSILNRFGIRPVLMENERCCGHDLLWTGDEETFEKLAKLNAREIEKTGAKCVIFSCPECYRTFKLDYPEYTRVNFETLHISEFLAEKVRANEIKFDNPNRAQERVKVTYQDSCRLGKHLGLYDPPRYVIGNVKSLELIEMENHRENAICCGTSAWVNCDSLSEMIQLERLNEAKATGADLLITACPKCQIHFRCAMSRRGTPKMDINDFSMVVAEAMGLG